MSTQEMQQHLNGRAWKTLERARVYSEELLLEVSQVADTYLAEQAITPEDVCFVVVGSVGRFEALGASDLDFTPVLHSHAALDRFLEHDQPLRERLRTETKVAVSKGEDLTRPCTLDQLASASAIGSPDDRSDSLTRRILILTEGKQAGGKLPLGDIRRAVMRAYSGEDRSRGRHVLSLCNDLARYYRTLCVEYKSKVEGKEEKWGIRNMKLRFNRKFWFFSCLMTIARLAESNPQGDEPYIEGLLAAFDRPPVQRLFEAVEGRLRGMVGRVVEPFTFFLEFVGDSERRKSLEAVSWDNRYDMRLDNPFHATKANSDQMHQEMLLLLDSLPAHQRQRILSWFLL